jgi:hypothetical protein
MTIVHRHPSHRAVLTLLDGTYIAYPCRWDGHRWVIQLAYGVACRDAWEGVRVVDGMAREGRAA